MKTPATAALLSWLALALTACSTSADPCSGFRPIRPAIADIEAMSSGLARQIVTHNETGARLCRWTP